MLNKNNDEQKDIRNDFLLELLYKLQNYYVENKKIVNKISISIACFLSILFLFLYINTNRNFEADKIFTRGMSYFKSGDIELALIEFNDLKLNFNSTRKGNLADYFLGKIYFDKNNYNDAFPYLNTYLKKGKSDSYLSSSYSMLAIISVKEGKFSEAGQKFSKASKFAISKPFKNRLLFQSLNAYLKSNDLINSEEILDILKSDDDIEKNHKNEYDRMFNYFKTLKKRNSNN